MKNIHVLPTDKPSRLCKVLGSHVLRLTKTYDGYNGAIYQHIYITSDEEIKEGDWIINNANNFISFASEEDKDLNNFENVKKIILTTDPQLIEDGVQSIDDEFLEWFVKNPSCEEVKVKRGFADGTDYGYNFLDYKIIIPKEEPKQDRTCTNNCSVVCGECQIFEPKQHVDYINKNIEAFDEDVKKSKQEPKQETLEEAAEKFTQIWFQNNAFTKELFINGAKWQQERMYSEEDLREAFNQGQENIDYHEIHGFSAKLTINEWYEQFKKK
jgi:hypothetical protein